jgi:hypothetical protein
MCTENDPVPEGVRSQLKRRKKPGESFGHGANPWALNSMMKRSSPSMAMVMRVWPWRAAVGVHRLSHRMFKSDGDAWSVLRLLEPVSCS